MDGLHANRPSGLARATAYDRCARGAHARAARTSVAVLPTRIGDGSTGVFAPGRRQCGRSPSQLEGERARNAVFHAAAPRRRVRQPAWERSAQGRPRGGNGGRGESTKSAAAFDVGVRVLARARHAGLQRRADEPQRRLARRRLADDGRRSRERRDRPLAGLGHERRGCGQARWRDRVERRRGIGVGLQYFPLGTPGVCRRRTPRPRQRRTPRAR